MQADVIQVVALCGSMRKGSYNMAALRAMQKLAPSDMHVTIADLQPVPLFNEDLEAEGLSPSVLAFREQVADADALLISTPEYNYSIPGVLKNAIDWLSRVDRAHPDQPTPINHKPLAIVGASVGHFGTARAQLQLRQVCVYTNMLPLNQPEVLIGTAQDKFDKDGNLTDKGTEGFLRELLDNLGKWTRRISPRYQ